MDTGKHIENSFRELIGALLDMKSKKPDIGRDVAVTVTMTQQAYAWFQQYVVPHLPEEEE